MTEEDNFRPEFDTLWSARKEVLYPGVCGKGEVEFMDQKVRDDGLESQVLSVRSCPAGCPGCFKWLSGCILSCSVGPVIRLMWIFSDPDGGGCVPQLCRVI